MSSPLPAAVPPPIEEATPPEHEQVTHSTNLGAGGSTTSAVTRHPARKVAQLLRDGRREAAREPGRLRRRGARKAEES